MNLSNGIEKLSVSELNEITGGIVMPVFSEGEEGWMVFFYDLKCRMIIHSKLFIYEQEARKLQKRWRKMYDLKDISEEEATKFLNSL